MAEVLCTFPGKNGDILWSLATAREISRLVGSKVDFKVMPYYERLVPLLEFQDYVDKVFAVQDWIRTHSNHGDGPGIPPDSATQGYSRVFNLAYRGHPGINAPSMCLIEFVAWQQGVKFTTNPVPFLQAPQIKRREKAVVTFSFNEQYKPQKDQFFESLQERFAFVFPDAAKETEFVDIGSMPWLEAASEIQNSALYLGCRSACWVVAIGLGKQTMTYEPHPARNRMGSLGSVFSCPYGQEVALPLNVNPVQCAEIAARIVADSVQNDLKSKAVSA